MKGLLAANTAWHGYARQRGEQSEGAAKRKRRFRIITEHHKTVIAPDLLNRHFSVPVPNQAWVGDMTCVRTRQGWLHLAILLDIYSRRIVGWLMGNHANQQLSLSALGIAVRQRRHAKGLIHHTDGGSPYSAIRYREYLDHLDIQANMNGKKSAYDNAVAESFFSNLKNEMIHHEDFQTRDEARAAIFDYIELFYNRKRIHETLGYRTPVQVEQEWSDS